MTPRTFLKRVGANFRFSPFITFFSITLAVGMLFAARWQWSRYHYKLALVQAYENHDKEAAIPFPVNARTAREFEPFLHRKVMVSGRYDFRQQVIVINRSHRTGPGFWLIAPFILDGSDTAVLVNRGFIPFRDDTEERWSRYDFPEETTIQAVVEPTVPDRWGVVPSPVGSDDMKRHSRWRYLDVEKMAQQLPYPVIPSIYLARLGAPPSGEFPAEAVSMSVPPSTHYWYTFEWIFLALAALTIGFVLQVMPRKKPPQGKASLRAAGGIFIGTLFLCNGPVFAGTRLEEVSDRAGIDEQLDKQIDLSLPFIDEFGNTSALRDFLLPNRPTLLVPVYYTCPRLCSLTQKGVAEALNAVPLKLGHDFRVISVSFNSDEAAGDAAGRAKEIQEMLKDREGAFKGWSFLTGSRESVRSLMEAIGFRTTREGSDIMHAAAIVVLTPEGKISRYFYGISYEPRDVSFSLIEASQGKIGSTVDRFLLYCFEYDAAHGKYTLAVMNITRVVCLGVSGILAFALLRLRRREISRT